MIEDIKKNQEGLIVRLMLFLLAMSVMVPYIFTGYASADDLQYSLNAQSGDLWNLTLNFAKHQGRFHFLLTWPFANFAYFIKNIYIAKAINAFFIVCNVFFVSRIVTIILKEKWIGYLIFLLSFVFISGKGAYNPIVCYPTYFSGSFLIILLSIYYSIKYVLTQKNIFRIFSVLFYAFGILFYETYILYFFVIGIIFHFLRPIEEDCSFPRKLMRTIRMSFPYLVVLFIYVVAYLGFRHFYPSQYGGASVALHFPILSILKATLNFASGAYPLCVAFSNSWTTFVGAPYFLHDSVSNILYIIISDHFDWIVKAIIIAFLTSYFFMKIETVHIKRVLFIFIVAFGYIYIPHIPLAITQKYLEYGGFQNYVTTYFAFVAVMVCFTLLFVFLYLRLKNMKRRMVFLYLFSSFIAFSSIINDYANFNTIKFLRKSMHIMTFMSKIAKTNDYKAIPDSTFIFVPQFYTSAPDATYLFSEGFNWSTFFYFESNKKPLGLSASPQELITELKKNQKPPYYFLYGRNHNGMDQYVAMAKISPLSQIDTLHQPILADSVMIYYYSQSKAFLLRFNIDSDASFALINNDTIAVNKGAVDLVVNNLVYKNDMMKLTIRAKSINMNSIVLSNNCLYTGKIIELK